MGLFEYKMDGCKLIGEGTSALNRFISEWDDNREFVLANTSGSTGKPKEIRLLKSDMMISAAKTCEFFGLTDKSVLALPLSVDYIAGKMMVCRAMHCGATLWVETPSREILRDFNGTEIDLIAIVPSQIDSLIKAAGRIHIKNVIVGGAPVSLEEEEKLKSLHSFATYGMTETCSHVALRRIGQDTYSALPGIEFEVDENNCLIVCCSDLSVGRLITNDVVDLIDRFHFKWLGRRDNVINSGGIKLHPEMIERKLSNAIDCAFYVTSRESDVWGEELVLVVESADEIESEKIFEFLDRYERPKAIIYIEKFDRTDSGKIIRRRF